MKTILTFILALIVSAGMAQKKQVPDSILVKTIGIKKLWHDFSSKSQVYFSSAMNDTLKCWFKEAELCKSCKLWDVSKDKARLIDSVFVTERGRNGYLIRNKTHGATLMLDKWVEDLTFLYADRKTVVKNHVLYYIEEK